MMLWLSSWMVVLGLGPMVLGAPEVATSQGRMVGHTLTSRNGREYAAFNGIPYAKPPVGNLRFMPPQPANPWNGVLNATNISPVCYQHLFPFLASVVEWINITELGQEDCLYINVYTPKLDGSYPVMVYVHGGAFTFGWPGSAMKPRYFMDEDVVIVTLSYRLGYFGFLSFEDDVIPGNYGLKDQALALEWVKKEIRNFGGDPDSITAFGISAGGASAHYLCSMPKTRALLKGCISQSGVGGTVWSLHAPGDAKNLAKYLAEKNGCDMQNSSQVLSCLQSLPVHALIPQMNVLHITNFPAPVIEKPSDTSVITAWPPNSTDFPWITGVMSNEGLLITEFIKAFASLTEKIIFYTGGEYVLAEILHSGSATLKDLYKITKRFFKMKDIFHILTDYERVITELCWTYPALKELSRHSGPKYFYRFEYTGGPSVWEQASNKTLDIEGACHGDDAPYFFDLSQYFQPKGWPGPRDIELSQTLIKLWVNFATNQVPSTDGLQWEQFGSDANYLDITNAGISMKKYSNYTSVLEFWNEINIPHQN